MNNLDNNFDNTFTSINNENNNENGNNQEENTLISEVNSFDELDIDERLLKGIYSMGFEYPSAIQRKAIPNMLNTDDLIAQAQVVQERLQHFLISAINKTNQEIKKPQIIVICLENGSSNLL